VPEDATLAAALVEMTRAGLGMTAVVTAERRVAGIYTDGDLRRTLEKDGDLRRIRIADVMTSHPHAIGPERLAVEAVERMDSLRINQLLVVDDEGMLVGALNTHDLLQARVI